MVTMKRGNLRMIRKRHVLTIVILMLAISACRNRSGQAESVIYDGLPVNELSEPDTATVHVEEETPKVEENTSTSSRSSTSSSPKSHNSRNYDNMRGFDPASEDDMDDNGMSRYMENNDEEGWD